MDEKYENQIESIESMKTKLTKKKKRKYIFFSIPKLQQKKKKVYDLIVELELYDLSFSLSFSVKKILPNTID